MRFYALVLGILAVWRLTHLLQAEDGPWDLVVRLRRAVGEGFWGRLLDCFYCLSLWIAAPFALFLGTGAAERALLWPALSGGACLLQGLMQRPDPALAAPAYYLEDEPGRAPEEDPNQEEDDDGMLRQTEDPDVSDG
jgi:hypothetical protein